jgi:hypothetical protein
MDANLLFGGLKVRALKDLRNGFGHSRRDLHAEEAQETFFGFMETIPSKYYYFAMVGSVVASLLLFLNGKRWESLFVGLWAPTLINVGLFYKMIRPSRGG